MSGTEEQAAQARQPAEPTEPVEVQATKGTQAGYPYWLGTCPGCGNVRALAEPGRTHCPCGLWLRYVEAPPAPQQ